MSGVQHQDILVVRRHDNELVVHRRLHDTGHAVRVRGTYATCRHLVCAGSQAERGLTQSGRGATAVTAVSAPAVDTSGVRRSCWQRGFKTAVCLLLRPVYIYIYIYIYICVCVYMCVCLSG